MTMVLFLKSGVPPKLNSGSQPWWWPRARARDRSAREASASRRASSSFRGSAPARSMAVEAMVALGGERGDGEAKDGESEQAVAAEHLVLLERAGRKKLRVRHEGC